MEYFCHVCRVYCKSLGGCYSRKAYILYLEQEKHAVELNRIYGGFCFLQLKYNLTFLYDFMKLLLFTICIEIPMFKNL